MKPDLNQDLHTHIFFSNGQDLNEGGGGGGGRHRRPVRDTSILDERETTRDRPARAKYGRGRLTPRTGRQLRVRRSPSVRKTKDAVRETPLGECAQLS